MTTGWRGVFPAATTQFKADLTVDSAATQRSLDALINDGVNGLIMLGTCGENNSLDPEEKRTVLKAAVEVVDRRVHPLGADVTEQCMLPGHQASAPQVPRFRAGPPGHRRLDGT